MSVIIVTADSDGTADPVVDHLNKRDVPVVRADLDGFTVEADINGDNYTGTIGNGTHATDLDDITGIWWRRPDQLHLPGGQPVDPATWQRIEHQHAVAGVLAGLGRPRWINHPHRNRYAAHKPLQLRLAAAAGLAVPETRLASDPARAKAICATGTWVYKPLRGQPVTGPGGDTLLAYTTTVAPGDVPDGEATGPLLLQQRIDKIYDVRTTYVAGRFYSVKAVSDTGAAPLDWRAVQDAITWEDTRLPLDVKTRLEHLVRDDLGLSFAACDLSRDRDGTWWFLEVNPNGQWWWEHPHNHDIADDLAWALTGDR